MKKSCDTCSVPSEYGCSYYTALDCGPDYKMWEDITYYKNGKKYRKLRRDEIIKKGAMHSFCGGELRPITNSDGQTIGGTPSKFSDEREFYNPIEEDSK